MWKGITLLLLVGISFWDSDVYALQGATPNDIPETIVVWTEHPFGSGKYGTTSMPIPVLEIQLQHPNPIQE